MANPTLCSYCDAPATRKWRLEHPAYGLEYDYTCDAHENIVREHLQVLPDVWAEDSLLPQPA